MGRACLFAAATLVLVAAPLAAAAVGAGTGEGPAPDDVRPCGSRGDGNRPTRPPPAGIRIGPLVIWPSVRTRVEDYGHEPWTHYVKAPIVANARARVTLAVPSEAAGLVGLQSRSPTTSFVSSVRFEACRESVRAFRGAYDGTVGKYTGFPFGFALARRSACVPLEVWVDGRASPIRRLVPFGRRSCS